jgi:universal stress protein E
VGEQIARTGDDIHAAVTVIGRHRYRWLHDFFLSGAAERIIKATSRPLLLVNLLPSGEYKKLLAPIRMSVSSTAALAALKKLELGKTANISVLHVFDSGVTRGRTGAHMSHEKIRSCLSRLEADASDFLSRHGIKPDQTLIRTGLVPQVIHQDAREIEADLIVVAPIAIGGGLAACLAASFRNSFPFRTLMFLWFRRLADLSLRKHLRSAGSPRPMSIGSRRPL